MKIMRRSSAYVTAVAFALLCLYGARANAADDYPSRPVTIVVPFPPGASNDVLGRFEADVLQRALHGSFIVENKPGAGGEIGISYVAKAAADGYTLLHAPSVITLLPFVRPSLSYDLAKDFAPVTLVGLTKFCLVVSPSLPINSVQDLIAYGKAHPDALTYASAGTATPHQIFAEQFKMATGINARHIPYKGTLPGLTDIASGNVSMEFSDLTPALPLIQAGKLRLIAVLSSKRDPDMPDVPALAETVSGYEAQSWQGFFAHAGTPKAIIDRLNAALVAELKKPETTERFKALGIVARWDTPAEFQTFIDTESAKWGKVIRAAGITE
ncbi:MAG TPA: tripartite tricarboxylate transporter substrate binding protein [Xanthobacteraceae bacterium]|nr:tripartite tricarboxylate transporter substrate binding protein [Xanthobacteraceae bacterium]